MSTRRDAREWAMQLLFQLDLNPSDELDGVFRAFWADKKPDRRGRSFAEDLVRGVYGIRERIDPMIQAAAEHWDVRRMSTLDRNVIRLAVYEMLHHADIPPAVVINEAVDIVKYFSSADSGKFVNGILDRIRKNLKLAPRGTEGRGAGSGGRK